MTDPDSSTRTATRERRTRQHIASALVDALVSEQPHPSASHILSEETGKYAAGPLPIGGSVAARGAASRLLDEASVEPLRAALITRVLNAVAQIAAELPTSALTEAVSAPSDYDALLRALQAALAAPRLEEQQEEERLLQQARARGLRSRERILTAEGGTLPSIAVAKHLHLTRQAVDDRRKKGRLVGLRTGNRAYAYPAWQFTQEGTLPGLEEMLAALAPWAPWTQAAFVLNPNSRLHGHSPLEGLREGNLRAVVQAAAAYGEHSA